MSKWPERRLMQFNLSGNFQLNLTWTQNASGKFAGGRALSRLKSTSTLKKKKKLQKKSLQFRKANRVFQWKTITTRLRKVLPFTSPLFVIFFYIEIQCSVSSPREKHSVRGGRVPFSKCHAASAPPPPLTTHVLLCVLFRAPAEIS